MNDILKQRLVGALILLSLGVVFWPIIFVEPIGVPLGEAAHIPARPGIDTTAIAAPSKEGLRPSPALAARLEESEQPLIADDNVIADPVERAALPINPAEQPVAQNKAPEKKAVTKKPTPKKHKTRTEAPAKPAIDADGVPIAWILQVASVSSPEKADALRRQLIDMGYKGYVKKIKRGNSVLLRVYVGPKFERARLESIQPAIDSEFKVKSMIRRYIP